MKKQFFIVTLLALVLGVAISTHYACKKETSVSAVNEQQLVSAPTPAEVRDGCFQCPGNMGCLIFSALPLVTLDLYGFAKDPEIQVPCGPPLRGHGYVALNDAFNDPSLHWGFKPLCDIKLPFRFGLKNPLSYPLPVNIDMQTRNSHDEYCSSQLTTTLPPGIIMVYRISEGANGSCSLSLESCSSTE